MTDQGLQTLSFDTDDGFGSRARIGLVVLENDQTVEAELGSLWPDGVAAFCTRIPMEDRVTPETLRGYGGPDPRGGRSASGPHGL